MRQKQSQVLMISEKMGRCSYRHKDEADGLLKVDIRWLKKHGFLQSNYWRSGTIQWTNDWSESKSSIHIEVSTIENDSFIRLSYIQRNENYEKESFNYKIPLVTTPCYFGGWRYWFLCQLTVEGIYCGRRVGVLFKGDRYFGCRHCHDLAYKSQNESRGKIAQAFDWVFKSEKFEEQTDKLRVKYWKGQPTKKYRKLINKRRIWAGYMPMMEGLIRSIGGESKRE